jgi:hypothetical protein
LDAELMSDERRERRFRMDLRTGKIIDLDAPPVDEDDWRLLGEIDPITGRSTVDYSKGPPLAPVVGAMAAFLTERGRTAPSVASSRA